MSLAELIPEPYRTPGLSGDELSRVQEEAEAVFPEDLCELLSDCLPAGRGFPDWRRDPASVMAEWRKRLLEGILADVFEENGPWLDEWDERPPDEAEARSIVTELVDAAPALIPIHGHRGIPNEPQERGNPVFSVMQTDVIVYGVDLDDYLRREFHGRRLRPVPDQQREIRFWTSLTLLG